MRDARVQRALQAKWDAVEDKPAVVVLAGLAALALYLGLAVLDRLDRLPLVRGPHCALQ